MIEGNGNPPAGWRTAKLGDVCELNPRRSQISRADDAPTTFLPMPAIGEGGVGIKRAELRPYRELRKGYTSFVEGDVLFAKITPCMQNAKHAIARDLTGGIGFGSTEFHVLRPHSEITSEWIHYFLLQPSLLADATRYFTGAVGQRRVPGDYLSTLEIPLPPLKEQRRIAARLCEQLSALAEARAALEAQLAAAESLPAANLRAVFESEEAQLWPRKAVGDYADIVGGIQKTPDRAPVRFHKAFLTVRNVQRGFLDLSKVERFEVTEAEFQRCRLLRGDLLIVEGNGSIDHIGRNSLFDEEGEWIHQNHIIRLRLARAAMVPEFVSAYLNSDVGRVQLIEKARTTTGLYTLSAGKIATLYIPSPPVADQSAIAAQLGASFAVSAELRQTLRAKLTELEKLPAALLRAAFQRTNYG
jgi:type I restriction enzyme, S subunit